MSFAKFAIAAAALAGSAVAQSCSASTTTIQSPADATGLASCQTFTGTVAIATSAAGQLDFGQLGNIKGDFTANSPNVTAITAGSLQSMGAFSLTNMSQLYTLSMQQLRTVDSIDWDGLATLQQPQFGTGLQSVNSKISVQNTMIQDLSSMNIMEIRGDCNIANNPALTALNWDTTNMTSFIASGNGIQDQKLNLTLSSLKSVTHDFTVSNCSSVTIGSLSTVGGLLSVRSSSMQSLLFPNLTSSTGGVEVANNAALNNVSFPMLNSTMASIKLVNNDHLGGNLSFPSLVQLRGALNVTGAFDSVMLPKINTISGTCYLWSTDDIDDTCSQVQKWKSSNVIQGDLPPGPAVSNGVVCHSMSKTASQSGGSGTTSSSSSSGSSSTTSKNAAPGDWTPAAGTLFGATGLVAAMLGMF